ncbi:threonine/homoserine/homoserine lactone efflux protein [Pseudacidovorax sp. 1753]|uniref:LysE family translocator n=1 Tax=Pseudacidovorax sp. 1753 TaxID=3156419 RepID=UPI0033962690
MAADTLALYALTSAILAITPGPTMLLALSNGIAGGMRRAAWGIAGASLGSTVVISVVALGLGSILAASRWVFDALRVAGVLYLAWLGLRMWRSAAPDLRTAIAATPDGPAQGSKALLRSLAVALTNPKALLFFAAFLPQFVDVHAPQAAQYLVLGCVFIAIDTAVMLAYAGAGTQVVRWLSKRSLQWLNKGCGAGMWLLAGALALWRRPGV